MAGLKKIPSIGTIAAIEDVYRRPDLLHVALELSVGIWRKITEPFRHVQAVRNFCKGRLRDIQKSEPVANAASCHSLDDVRGNRVGSSPHLTRKTVALFNRERGGEPVNSNKQVVGPLPGNKLLVTL